MADQTPVTVPLPTTLALPAGLSPDQLDITTELTALLARLRAPVNLPGLSSSSTTGQTPAAPTPSQPQLQPPASASQSQSQNNTGGAAAGAGGSGSGDISLRDFPASTDHLRLKLQEARAAVLALPDMDKSVAQQEAEIKMLEDRIRRQREQLAALREKGDQFASSDRMVE